MCTKRCIDYCAINSATYIRFKIIRLTNTTYILNWFVVHLRRCPRSKRAPGKASIFTIAIDPERICECLAHPLHALLAVHEKLEPLPWSCIALPETHKPMPQRQPPMPTISRLMIVRNIFFGELPYCPQFRKSQKTPLSPSGIG